MHSLTRAAALTTLLCCVQTASVRSQTYYHNLDAGQPGRVEDAAVTPQYALAIDLSPLQFERLAGGSSRYRAEPKLAYGILPFTDLEIRVPLVQLVPPGSSGAASTSGIAGVSIGLSRAFNVETTSLPALALAGEVSLPIGTLAGEQASFFIKGLATRTAGPVRFHINAGAGTYSVRAPSAAGSSCDTSGERLIVAGDTTCSTGPIIIYDSPCNLAPVGGHLGSAARAARFCMARAPSSGSDSTAAAAATTFKTNGARWFAGIAVDHAFALQSTLLTAGIYAERFVGLYPITDWTAEAGIRRQLTPIIVVNAGAGRHFAGAIPSTFIMGGASFELATPSFLGK